MHQSDCQDFAIPTVRILSPCLSPPAPSHSPHLPSSLTPSHLVKLDFRRWRFSGRWLGTASDFRVFAMSGVFYAFKDFRVSKVSKISKVSEVSEVSAVSEFSPVSESPIVRWAGALKYYFDVYMTTLVKVQILKPKPVHQK